MPTFFSVDFSILFSIFSSGRLQHVNAGRTRIASLRFPVLFYFLKKKNHSFFFISLLNVGRTTAALVMIVSLTQKREYVTRTPPTPPAYTDRQTQAQDKHSFANTFKNH